MPDKTFANIINGTSTESEVEKNVVPYSRMGKYKAYLSSVVVDKQKYPKFKGKYLFVYLQNHLNQLRNRGYFVNEIVAIAATIAGEKTLFKMGFRKIARNLFIYKVKKHGLYFFNEMKDKFIEAMSFSLAVLTVKDVDV